MRSPMTLESSWNQYNNLFDIGGSFLNCDIEIPAEKFRTTNKFVCAGKISITNNSFATIEKPGCLFASKISLVAQDSISLGISENESNDLAMSLYAEKKLTIKTKELLIGEINLLAIPQIIDVSCEVVKLVKKARTTDPHYFSIIQGWIDPHKTKIIIKEQ